MPDVNVIGIDQNDKKVRDVVHMAENDLKIHASIDITRDT